MVAMTLVIRLLLRSMPFLTFQFQVVIWIMKFVREIRFRLLPREEIIISFI